MDKELVNDQAFDRGVYQDPFLNRDKDHGENESIGLGHVSIQRKQG
jgi:hypothetical protein